MTTSLFDIEQDIMKMWSTADDITALIEMVKTSETVDIEYILHMLHCIVDIHNLRGETALNSLTTVLREAHASSSGTPR